MRTTVDLPDDLIRAAKARAAERGETLKEMFTRLLSREVRSRAGQRESVHVSLPLVGSSSGGPNVSVTNADIETILAAEDAERYGN